MQNDVTQKDVELSFREGFKSVEHLKRYSTLGMATDQGKTSNILGLASMAKLKGTNISEVGTTIFRPPYVPVAISAFAGRSRGKDFRPTRLTPSHSAASKQNAVFVRQVIGYELSGFQKREKHFGDKVWIERSYRQDVLLEYVM